MMPQPSSPARGHRDGIEQGSKEAEIANAQLDLREPCFAQRLERESKDGFVLLLPVRGSARFDAGLAESAGVRGRGPAGLIAKGEAIIAIPGQCAAVSMASQMQPAGGDRQVWSQTKLLAVAIDEHIG